MGEEMIAPIKSRHSAFNSEFEIGFRSIVVLAELFPTPADLQRLVFYDYLLLHSGDVSGGPRSLHPPTPYRSQEYAVRRDILRNGLLLMASRGLVIIRITKKGIEYAGSEATIPFLDRLTSVYSKELGVRAKWLCARFDHSSDQELSRYFSENLGRWGSEFVFMKDFSEDLSALASFQK